MMWRRGKLLGSGASAMVSLAEVSRPGDDDDRSFHLPSFMAVKSALVSESRSLSRETRLLNEFEGCPYILRCFGADITIESEKEWYNILLEYAAGGSLADRVRSSGRGLPEREARRYTKSVLMGLSYIHKQGYVHCDIKPHNILLVESERPLNGKRKRVDQESTTAKIADFGLAKKAGKRPKKVKLRGTPLYIAPESILHNEYEPQVDIWALGCTVLQIITGKQPWTCDRNMETEALLFRIASTDQVPEIPSWLSKEAQDFLKKCLVRDPKSRWTADMLLGHPFVSAVDGAITQRITNRKEIKAEAVKVAHESSLHLPKPYAIMLHSASGPDVPESWTFPIQSDVSGDFGEQAEQLHSQISFHHACKKRNSLEEDAGQWQSGISFQPNGLRRYWGIRRIEVITNSSTAIEIFN